MKMGGLPVVKPQLLHNGPRVRHKKKKNKINSRCMCVCVLIDVADIGYDVAARSVGP